MTDFLLFTVYAPLASWGEPAVGEVRRSWDRPSRSAVLGMVAAALGIRREQQDLHDALDRAVGVAVRLDATGTDLDDYHTTQTVSPSVIRKVAPTTRKSLLESGERQTILSRRSLRQESLATVAVWLRASAPWTLEQLEYALQQPAFTLYAGRKANPLGLPLRPRRVQAETLKGALQGKVQLPPELLWLRPRRGWGREVAHDRCEGFPSGFERNRVRVHIRRDGSPHRTRWHFSERHVEIGLLDEETEEAT